MFWPGCHCGRDMRAHWFRHSRFAALPADRVSERGPAGSLRHCSLFSYLFATLHAYSEAQHPPNNMFVCMFIHAGL